MKEARWHLAVLIPARDEEELLPQCLRSVKAACAEAIPAATCDVVVAVDRSIDGTWEAAVGELGRTGAVVRSSAGSVGTARALAAAAALKRYEGRMDYCWLANTDADCEVPTDWLTRQLTLAQTGAEAVAGTIDVIDFAGHSSVVEERFRRTYRIEADGSHPHVHGANLGVRADWYRQAGGWRELVCAEDHDLWERLGAAGARRLSVNTTRVITSGRRLGRAPQGFAAALAAHNPALP